MSDKQANIIIAISLVLSAILFWWGIVRVWNINAGELELSDKETEQASDLILILGNSFKSTANPVFLKPLTYGSLIEKVIDCESGWDNSKRGRAGEIGLCQFMPKTWDWMCDKFNFTGDIYNEQDQIELMMIAFENGLAKHWTCYRKLIK